MRKVEKDYLYCDSIGSTSNSISQTLQVNRPVKILVVNTLWDNPCRHGWAHRKIWVTFRCYDILKKSTEQWEWHFYDFKSDLFNLIVDFFFIFFLYMWVSLLSILLLLLFILLLALSCTFPVSRIFGIMVHWENGFGWRRRKNGDREEKTKVEWRGKGQFYLL